LSDHAGTFAKDSTDLGYCDVLQHDIDTGDARPIKQSPGRPPLAACTAEDQILDEMLESGVIEPSCSPCASPVCLVKKKEGTYRFCVDYRRVNSVSKKDAFPIPDIQDALDHLRGAKYFATFDLLSSYWQIQSIQPYRTCKGTVGLLHTQRLVPVHKNSVWTGRRSFVILSSHVYSLARPPL